jgi:hypothetical protein
VKLRAPARAIAPQENPAEVSRSANPIEGKILANPVEVKASANLVEVKASANPAEMSAVEMSAAGVSPAEVNLAEFAALAPQGKQSPLVLLKNPYFGNHQDKLNTNPFENGGAIALAGARSVAKHLQLLILKPHSRLVKAI